MKQQFLYHQTCFLFSFWIKYTVTEKSVRTLVETFYKYTRCVVWYILKLYWETRVTWLSWYSLKQIGKFIKCMKVYKGFAWMSNSEFNIFFICSCVCSLSLMKFSDFLLKITLMNVIFSGITFNIHYMF